MSGGFFRGTSADQDTRFSNKEAKLLKSQKFAAELEHPVDISKVKMDVMRPWIATRVTELLGFEDEVLINFIYGLLDKKSVDGKQIQIQLTGFMEKNTGRFMKELWALLLSAQNNVSGVPQQFLDAKEEESRKKQVETDRIKNEILWRKSKENKELEEEYKKKMEAEVGGTRANTHDTSGRKRSMFSDANVDISEVGVSADLRAIDRIVKSPLELELAASRRSRSKSLTRDRSSSRSPPPKVRHESRSVSRSPMHQRDSVERRSYSQSRSPPRRHSPRRLRSPPKRRSPHLRRRSPSPSRSPIRRRSPSPSRRRNPTFSRSRFTSPVRRRSPSPGGNRSLSSSQQRSMSPARLRSRSPLRSPSPNYRKSSNPIQRRSPSPVRRERSPSPVRRQRSPTPVRRRRSPSPVRRRRSSPPTRRRSPPPTRRRSPSPVRRRSPYVRSPRYPRRSPKASPRRHDFHVSPQRRQRSRSPYREGSPYRGRRNISQEQEGRLNGFETTEHQDRRTDRVRGRRSPARVGLTDEGDQLNQRKNSSAVARLPVTSLRSPQRDMRSLSHKGPTLSSDEREISDGYESPEPAYETSRRDARRETTYNSPIRSSRDMKVRHDSPATSIEQEGLEKSRDNVSQKNQSAKSFHALYDEVEYAPGRPENSSFNHEGISIGEDPDAGVDKREKHRKFGIRSGYINDDEVGRDGETRKLKREGSNIDDDNASPRDEKKEAKRRKKEERKMRKEEKRRRREERHRRREERRANKTKTKSVNTVTPPSDLDENRNAAGHLSDDDAYVRKGFHQSDGEDVESEQKRLEIELRKRALESLKAKKATTN